MMPILLWLVVLPIIGAILSLIFGDKPSRFIALGTSVIGLVFALLVFYDFDADSRAMYQLVVSYPWISHFQIRFSLGIDALSLPLVLLTKFMMPVALLASFNEKRRTKTFMASFLCLDAAMTGTFLATDIFLFYVFWEAMLVPMILIIGIWGGHERIYAAIKFFLFTFAGSIFMLVGVLTVFFAYYQQFGVYSADITQLMKIMLSNDPVFLSLLGLSVQDLVFIAFTIAFIIKVPLFPFHTWLSDAHGEAPTGGSILLAAVLLKMGTYGLLRFSIPLCPASFDRFCEVLVALSLIGILYGAWVANAQRDFKKLVAYSSISHLGFVVLGIAMKNEAGLTGATLQMVNHGLSTGALFFLVGALYDRRHTKAFSDYGGVAEIVPFYAILFVFVGCSSMAVPGLNGFVGEFLILYGTIENPVVTVVAVLGVIFGAVYMLNLIRRILFGPLCHVENRTLKDLTAREWAAIAPVCVMILFLGIFPNVFLGKLKPFLKDYWTKQQSAQRVHSPVLQAQNPVLHSLNQPTLDMHALDATWSSRSKRLRTPAGN